MENLPSRLCSRGVFCDVVAGTWLSVVPFLGQNHVLHSPCRVSVSSKPPSLLVYLYLHACTYVFTKPIKYIQSKMSRVLFIFWRSWVMFERTNVPMFQIITLKNFEITKYLCFFPLRWVYLSKNTSILCFVLHVRSERSFLFSSSAWCINCLTNIGLAWRLVFNPENRAHKQTHRCLGYKLP